MDAFRFFPPSALSLAASTSLFLTIVSAMPRPQEVQNRFLPGLFPPVPQTNPDQGLQNTLAAGGLGAVGAVAASNCLFGGNCDLAFRPSLGVALDANGNVVPQLGVQTQVGEGPAAPTFGAGLQLDSTSQNGIGGFVSGGINNGDPNSISPGVSTGFGFSQGANGQTQATAQLGGNIQAPQVGGINFGAQNQPGNIAGVQPTFLNRPILSFLQG